MAHSRFVRWLLARPGVQRVPLFATDASLCVQTRVLRSGRRVLRRSAEMERGVIDLVERGFADSAWRGLLYVMAWGKNAADLQPLYIGKASRYGRKHAVSSNLVNLRTAKSKFARWGDGNAYHIGMLSAALFGEDAGASGAQKYGEWAKMLFRQPTSAASEPAPRLREEVFLYLVPWFNTSVGPAGASVLEAAEAEAINLAIAEYEDSVLNTPGEQWWKPASRVLGGEGRLEPRRPVELLSRGRQLAETLTRLGREAVVGLDVETAWPRQELCLVQLGSRSGTFVVDVLDLSREDLQRLSPVLSSTRVRKVIHNAAFERRVLGARGFELSNVYDTLKASRELHGYKIAGGHGLAAVCARELGLSLDKTEQRSDWARRPLSPRQLQYAALDAEILVELYDHFAGRMPELGFEPEATERP